MLLVSFLILTQVPFLSNVIENQLFLIPISKIDETLRQKMLQVHQWLKLIQVKKNWNKLVELQKTEKHNTFVCLYISQTQSQAPNFTILFRKIYSIRSASIINGTYLQPTNQTPALKPRVGMSLIYRHDMKMIYTLNSVLYATRQQNQTIP